MNPAVRYQIKHFKTLKSTNDKALIMARKGSPEGLVITADYQTQGRGREKKKWVSPRGWNLLFSILVRPQVKAHKAPLLTQLAAQAVRKVLAALCPETLVKIKKPNDVLMNGKKICGILVESSTQAGKIHFAVVGMGVNVLGKISAKIAGSTSIHEETGKKMKKKELLDGILAFFSQKYAENFQQDSEPLYNRN